MEIAVNWKGPTQPTLTRWHEKLWCHLVMCKITGKILQVTTPTYKSSLAENWFPVLSHMAIHQITSSKFLDESFLTFQYENILLNTTKKKKKTPDNL